MAVHFGDVLPWSGGVDGELVTKTLNVCERLQLDPISADQIEKIFKFSCVIDPKFVRINSKQYMSNQYYVGLFESTIDEDGKRTIPMLAQIMELITKLEKNFVLHHSLQEHLIPPKNPILFVWILISISASLLDDSCFGIKDFATFYNQYNKEMHPQSNEKPLTPKQLACIQAKVLDLYWDFEIHNYVQAAPMTPMSSCMCGVPSIFPKRRQSEALNNEADKGKQKSLAHNSALVLQ